MKLEGEATGTSWRGRMREAIRGDGTIVLVDAVNAAQARDLVKSASRLAKNVYAIGPRATSLAKSAAGSALGEALIACASNWNPDVAKHRFQLTDEDIARIDEAIRTDNSQLLEFAVERMMARPVEGTDQERLEFPYPVTVLIPDPDRAAISYQYLHADRANIRLDNGEHGTRTFLEVKLGPRWHRFYFPPGAGVAVVKTKVMFEGMSPYTPDMRPLVRMLRTPPAINVWQRRADLIIRKNGMASRVLYNGMSSAEDSAGSKAPFIQTSESVESDFEKLGREAFARGAKPAPAADRMFMERAKTLPTGDTKVWIRALDAWLKGWHAANLAAPTESVTTESAKPEVGQMVRFKTPGPNGPMRVSGLVVKPVKKLRDDQIEVRASRGGYYTVSVSELFDADWKPIEEGTATDVEEAKAPAESATVYTAESIDEAESWQRITDAGLHGVFTTIGDRRIEVVRAYAGDWRIYVYRDGKAERGEDTHYPTIGAAKAAAARITEATATDAELLDQVSGHYGSTFQRGVLRGVVKKGMPVGRGFDAKADVQVRQFKEAFAAELKRDVSMASGAVVPEGSKVVVLVRDDDSHLFYLNGVLRALHGSEYRRLSAPVHVPFPSLTS